MTLWTHNYNGNLILRRLADTYSAGLRFKIKTRLLHAETLEVCNLFNIEPPFPTLLLADLTQFREEPKVFEFTRLNQLNPQDGESLRGR